jgi:MYXO-CTERM domain-containing protein
MRLARLGLVIGWVPVVFVSTMVVPEQVGVLGMGPALGCSAGGNVPDPPAGFTWLKPSMMSLTERTSVPVGTDGFFVIDAEGHELSADSAESGMTVEVRDATGELVPGQVWLLKEKQPGWYLFGWEAATHLEVGAELTATLSAAPLARDGENVGGDFPLVVMGEPAELSESTLSFPNWVGFFGGEEPTVDCTPDPDYSSCGPPERVQVPATLRQHEAANAVWQLPELSVGVAWEARLAPAESDSDVLLPGLTPEYLVDTPETEVSLGMVVFPTDAEQHCVVLSVQDLRVDDYYETEVCVATEAPSRFDTDSQLRACLEPPTDGSAEAWCRLKGEQAPSECEAILEPEPGVGGAGGSEAEPGGDDPLRSSRTSKGCQLGGVPSGSGGWLALAAFVALRRRRRR